MSKKFIKTLGSAVAGTMLVFGAGTLKAQDSSSPIVIPTHNWSSQVVMAYIIGGITMGELLSCAFNVPAPVQVHFINSMFSVLA